jgi:CspA family cold shock protein
VVDGSFSSRPCVERVLREENKGKTPMPNGTIKKVVSDRGFGFIAAEDGKEYFFHRDGLDRSLDFDRLNGGEKVTFEVEASPRGPRASKVAAAGA